MTPLLPCSVLSRFAAQICAPARADDPCDKPEYCRPDAATCDDQADNRWPLVWSGTPSCASDPTHGVECWSDGEAPDYLPAPTRVHVRMPDGGGAWMGAGSATCGGMPVTPRVRYFLTADLSGGAGGGAATSFTCPTAVDYSTSWWGSAGLTTVAASPLLPMLAETSGNGTGYDFRLGGAVVASLQGRVVFVIAELYDPYPRDEVAVGHACLRRLVMDSSPPFGPQLACPLPGSGGAGLIAPEAEPCFSEQQEDAAASGGGAMRFIANGTALPVVFEASATDPQSSTLSSTSGIETVTLRALFAPPRSLTAALPTAPGRHCANADCAASLLASGWTAVSEFGLAAPLFSGGGSDGVGGGGGGASGSTFLSSQTQALASGWAYEAVPPQLLTPSSPPPAPPSAVALGFPPPGAPPPPLAPPNAVVCSNACTRPASVGGHLGGHQAMPHGTNGVCDDGGSGSQSAVCAYGSDCDDCGPRASQPPAAPPPVPIQCCRQVSVEGAVAIDRDRMGPFLISQTAAGMPHVCAESEGQQCECPQGQAYLGRKYREYVRLRAASPSILSEGPSILSEGPILEPAPCA